MPSEKAAQQRRLLASQSYEWYTPQHILDAAREVMGGIDLDPATSVEAQQRVQAKRFYTKEDDGLRPENEWAGRVWLNPPYGGAHRLFVARLLDEYGAGRVEQAIVLLNSNSADSSWFDPLFDHTLCFCRGRVAHHLPGGALARGSTHGTALVYLGPRWELFAEVFGPIGNVVRRVLPR